MAVEEDPMSWLAYHPERVEELWRHTRRAVEELAAIASDDPAAAEAMRTVRLAQAHLEGDWLPLLDRIRSSTALIAPIVNTFTAEERAFFEGFVSECAASVAAELSHYDAHPDYQLDVLPDDLRTLDDRGEWDWLARLYLIEQYHQMVDTGAVELQRDGEHYWIDPLELTNTNKIVMGEVILAGVAAAGRFSKAGSGGISAAGAHAARAPLPAPRPVVAPTSITGYTKHGLERVMNKNGVGVSPSAVRDAVRDPIRVTYQPDRDTFRYLGATAVVVLDQRGRVVTAWPISRAGWRGAR
jgi:hypothetical protein